MVTTGAILHGDLQKLLEFNSEEHPVALQLGGSDPSDLAECAKIGEDWGYDEINLNVGCPSSRVQRGSFGACLMAEPDLVAECVAAMSRNVELPITVKTRIGIDDKDSYEELAFFIGNVASAGCQTFIIHARKAWLSGLSPRENRELPPLRYDIAARLKQDFPMLQIILNGGILTLEEAEQHLQTFDGVMLGRAVYHNPYLLAGVDEKIFGMKRRIPERAEVVDTMLSYIGRHLDSGVRLHAITRHMLGLYHGQPGGRAWRRQVGELSTQKSTDISLIGSILRYETLHP